MTTFYNRCINCNQKITFDSLWNDKDFIVGKCPWCNKTLFFIALPFQACGLFGPVQTTTNDIFYYLPEYLGNLYVDIKKGE